MTSMELLTAIKKYLVTSNRYLKILVVIGVIIGGFAANKFVDQKVESEVVAYFNEHKNELKGEKGNEGVAGEQGPQGGAGIKGAVGATGAKGVTGVKGSTGTQGDKGNIGVTGSMGATGRSGNDGCTWMPYSQYWYCP